MVTCTIHLLSLQKKSSQSLFLDELHAASNILIKGIPHGWVHEPRRLNYKQLTDPYWDLFLLTEASGSSSTLDDLLDDTTIIATHVSVPVSLTESHFSNLVSRINSGQKPAVSSDTPPLPSVWSYGGIPRDQIVQASSTNQPLKSGELKLDPSMATFLTDALPETIRDEPICYFNFFKYPGGDRTVHDAYMQGFKDNFGSAAGASVLFMGPVDGPLKCVEGSNKSPADVAVGREGTEEQWDDANLVQYDSVWHYAYMLSTDVYQELNKQKMEGLEDTCILLVSEVEVFRGR